MTRIAGFSGTTFRLQGGSLTDGPDPPFDKRVFHYPIVAGIHDGYLVPAFSAQVDDKIDPTKLKVRQGEYTPASQDDQMIELIDSHVCQMRELGKDRKAWLVFEASTKAAKAMCARLNEWKVPTGLVLGETPAGERAATIAAFRAGRLRCMVNVSALSTGFDVPEVDMLVMRFKTKSLGKYIQVTGRLLRTVGGTIEKSIAAGKADGLLLDYGSNVADHGPLDFIRPKDTLARLVSCECCGKRNAGAAARCWACNEPMTKMCPACLEPVQKGTLDCPHCQHDMRAGERGPTAGPKLLDTPSSAALISAYRPGTARAGGWLPIRKVWQEGGTYTALVEGGERFPLPEALAALAADARWIRTDGTVLVPNGASRTSARQYDAAGNFLVVPMPQPEGN